MRSYSTKANNGETMKNEQENIKSGLSDLSSKKTA